MDRDGEAVSSSSSSQGQAAASGAAAMTIEKFPDHLLQVILLRITDSARLIRAAATCRRWRHIIADTAFLHSFRTLHGSHRVAGAYHTVDPTYGPPLPGGNFAFMPSTPLTGVDCRCFSVDFLPDEDSYSWELIDSRGSLLLLSKHWPGFGGIATARRFTDIVVCEPLSRRYQLIKSPADMNLYMCLGVFLLDSQERHNDGMSNFRVIAVLFDHHRWLEYRGMPMSFMFSSDGDGTWQEVQVMTLDDVDLPDWIERITFVGRANGRFYWGIEDEDGATFVLDENTTEFSITMFPENIWAPYDKYTFRVIDGDDGDLCVVRVVSNDLKVFRQLAGNGEWVLEKMVCLPEATRELLGHEEGFFQHGEAMIVAANAEFVLVTPREKNWIFSVVLETMEVEREHERNRYPGTVYQYESLPWPPALQVCTDG